MRTFHSIALTALAVTLASCAKSDGTTDTLAARDSAGMTRDSAGGMAGMSHDSARTAGSSGAWNEGQIVGYITAVSNGEIAEGRLAGTKARHAEVKAFGRQMVTDHQAMLAAGTALAKKGSLTADTTRGEVADHMKEGREHLKELTEKEAGADWDKEYLDHQIDAHGKVLERLQEAANATQNADLRAMLVKGSGKVQEHITKARAIKEKYPTS